MLRMKILKINLLLILISSLTVHAQRSSHLFQTSPADAYSYFIINGGDQKWEIDKIDISSSAKTFDCDQKKFTGELYNLHLSSGRLILFSILPSPVDGGTHWSKVDLKDLKSNVITSFAMDSLSSTNLKRFEKSGYSNRNLVKLSNIKIILKKANEYYLPDTDCLTELFDTNVSFPNSGFSNQNPYVKIDTSIVQLNIAQFEKQYQSKNKGAYSYNNPYSEDNKIRPPGFRTPLLMFSHSGAINNMYVQYFWTLDDWSIDGLNLERGIDRFIFCQGVGIIGGDFTFYFKQIFRTYLSANCEKVKLSKYLNNEMELMPVKVTMNIQKY